PPATPRPSPDPSPDSTIADPRPAALAGSAAAPPEAPAAAAARGMDPAAASALGAALAQPLSVVDLDQWVSEPERAALVDSGWTPVGVRGRSQGTRSDVGVFVSGAPKRPPDSAGDLAVISPMRLFAELAIAHETGLLRFELGGQVKEIYLMNGAPESVASSVVGERFGEYLLGKGA